MQQRDLPGKVQSQTCPTRLRLQAVEGFEDILVLVRRNARAFIADFDAGLVDGYGDRARAATMIDGIADEICQCPLDLQDVDLDMDLVGWRLQGKIIARFDGERGEVGRDPTDKVAEIDDLALVRRAVKQLVVEQLLRCAG